MRNDIPSARGDEDIQANELAKKIASEPRTTKDRLKDIPVTPGNYRKFRGADRKELPKGIVWGIIGLIVIFVGGSIISYYVVRRQVVHEISARASVLAAGVNDLQNFDPQSAQAQFSQLNSEPSLGGVISTFSFLFKGGTAAIQSFGDISKQLASLSSDVITLQDNAVAFLTEGNGGVLVANLTSIDRDLTSIDADSNALAAVMPLAGSSTNGLANAYVPAKAQIEGATSFLNEFIPWLASSTPHHMLVMLQNPSEEKPAGGFLGSYADVTIASGTIVNVDVHDIADVDTAFKDNIVPPVPLQLETSRFRPADANWFFDFPSSASETISMFERSGLYAASGTSFDGVIAVSPTVVSDLLAITGPIAAGKPTTTFSSSTVVVQIQKLVQAGQARGATYPKSVVRSLASAIFAQLASPTSTLNANASGTIAGLVSDWITKKDVMIYFKNPTFQNFAQHYGATGDVYQLPQKFNGDYLAVVNADINADKSELYVSQKINFDAEIGADGTVSDHVTIDRTHGGNKSPYPWYQTTNQDYLQIFTAPGSSISNENGGVVRTVPAPINYVKAGYSTDPLIASIESSTLQLFTYPAVATQEQFGKDVFTVWSRVRAGATTELAFDYSHHLFVAPAPGVQYQFVFEKQAGATGDYTFEIDAPLGYAFAENGLASFMYHSTDPPGRMVVTLTLQQL